MTTQAPARVDVRQLRNQAKDLLKAFGRRDPDVSVRVRSALPEWTALPNDSVYTGKFSLRDAQRVVARELGFDGWADLISSVDRSPPRLLGDLRQLPLDATQMGVLHGVVNYLDMPTSVASVFGGTGYAFVINIHRELCPSGPFIWRRTRLNQLVRNLGVETTDLGFYTADTPLAVRERVDAKLRQATDAGIPCSLCNDEYQVITGYDDTGFYTVGPYPDHLKRRLTFGTWQEWGSNVYAYFYTHRRGIQAERIDLVRDSLAFATDLFERPHAFAKEPYGIGPAAYDHWLEGLGEYGATFGNTWNAKVWAECRRYAAAYLHEIGAWFPQVQAVAAPIAETYSTLAKRLAALADPSLKPSDQAGLVRDARGLDSEAVDRIHHLLTALPESPTATQTPPRTQNVTEQPPLLANA